MICCCCIFIHCKIRKKKRSNLNLGSNPTHVHRVQSKTNVPSNSNLKLRRVESQTRTHTRNHKNRDFEFTQTDVSKKTTTLTLATSAPAIDYLTNTTDDESSMALTDNEDKSKLQNIDVGQIGVSRQAIPTFSAYSNDTTLKPEWSSLKVLFCFVLFFRLWIVSLSEN